MVMIRKKRSVVMIRTKVKKNKGNWIYCHRNLHWKHINVCRLCGRNWRCDNYIEYNRPKMKRTISTKKMRRTK